MDVQSQRALFLSTSPGELSRLPIGCIGGRSRAAAETNCRAHGEGEIHKNIVEADLVDGMVALPDKGHGMLCPYVIPIPACLWFLARDKSGRPPAGWQVNALEYFRLPRVSAPVAEVFSHAIKPLFVRSSVAVRESRTSPPYAMHCCPS